MQRKNEQNEVREQQMSKGRTIDELTKFNEIIKRSKRITMRQLKRLVSDAAMLRMLIYDGGPTAPVGIGVYGIDKDGTPFALTTDAVRGEVDISPDVQAKVYDLNGDPCRCHEEDLTVQLNAYLVAELDDGTTQYYWLQNIIASAARRRKLWISNNIHSNNILRSNSVKGNGKVDIVRISVYDGKVRITESDAYYVYAMRDAIPLDRVELETWAYVDKGKIIVEFHANGRTYDEVAITPIVKRKGRLHHVPAVSANIVAAPILVGRYTLMDLELVVGGVNLPNPIAILKSGRIGLGLRVHKNGTWIPPPSAWSIGYATIEAVRARAVPQGVGSVVVEPGKPSLQPLW